jgi:APA family basic amino acid/polyamine antiporter
VLGILNYIGLREASRFNAIATVLEIAGLVGILALFFWSAGFSDFEFSIQSPTGIGGLLSAVVFVFFAYLGFEVLPTISEEVKDVRRTLPKALLISIAITSVLYILVAIAFTSALTHVEIVSAVESGKGALAVAAGKFGGNTALLALGIVALFSTANTILISAIGVSRMMYGMAKEKALPGQLLSTTRSGVPGNAIIISTALSVLFVLVGDIEFIARISVAGLLMTFIIDNLSVICLRLKKPGLERPFRIPFSISRIPLFPALAIVSMGLLLVHEFWAGPALLLGFAGLVIAGIALNEAEYRLTGD